MSENGLNSGSDPLSIPEKPSWEIPFKDLHHKFAVIDNRTVNDEVLLVIDSPLLAAHFTREMDRMWRTGTLGITDALRRKLDQYRSRCGSGVELR